MSGFVEKKDGTMMRDVAQVVDTGDGFIRVTSGEGSSEVIPKSEIKTIYRVPIRDAPKK